jgi:hypothetical protein
VQAAPGRAARGIANAWCGKANRLQLLTANSAPGWASFGWFLAHSLLFPIGHLPVHKQLELMCDELMSRTNTTVE